MSPATKAPKTREVKGEGTGSVVKVTPEPSSKQIRVTWFCGGSRVFEVEELRRQIAWLDKHGSKYDMWFNNHDSSKSRFWVKLDGGKLTANDGMRENGKVSWANLKRALQATIKEVAEG